MAKSRNRIPTTPRRTNNRAIAHIQRPMFYGGPDPITLNKMHLVINEVRTLMREQWDRVSRIDPRRDLDEECGYPKHDLTPEGYRDLIATEPVAELVNAIYPLESWKSQPLVYDSDDPSDVTPFMDALNALPSTMGVEPSYHVQDSGNLLWPFLLNADILAGYGRYGIILIGLDDGQQDLRTPVVPRAGMRITFLQAFPEHLAKISAFDMNRGSRRYGMPIEYMIRMSDPQEQSNTEINEPYTTEYVHWSRIVHITDKWHTASSSRIFAIPRCKPVLRPILDIKKVRGSSAEMYYKGAFFGLHFGTHPQLGPDADVDRESLEDMYEEYINGLQRALFTSGMTVDPLSPTVVGPREQIEVQLEAISIKTRTPKRVLMGSERGELSSEDDRKDYNTKLISREVMHNGPHVIVPLLDRLINFGCLPRPRNPGYRIWWPDLASLSEAEKAEVLLKRTQAYGTYVSQGVETAIPLRAYMTGFDGMSEEEADSIINTLAEGMEGESETSAPLLGLVGGVDAMLQMFDRFASGAISEDTLKQLIMLFYKVDEEKAEEIIADGLPEPPPGSERDLPPLPPMKPVNGKKALPPSKSPIVANWLIANSGTNCGVGPEGFQQGNTCAAGGVGTSNPTTGKTYKESKGLNPEVNAQLVKEHKIKLTVDAKLKDRAERALSHVLSEKALSQHMTGIEVIVTDLGKRHGTMRGNKLYIDTNDLKDSPGFAAGIIRHEVEHKVLDKLKIPTGQQENRVRATAGLWAAMKASTMAKTNPEDAAGLKRAAKEQGIKVNQLSEIINNFSTVDVTDNVFCPTGPGGGQDPTCSPGGTRSSPSFKDRVKAKIKEVGEKLYLSETASALKKLVVEGLDPLTDKKIIAITGFVKKMAGLEPSVAGAVAVGAWALTGPFGTVASDVVKRGIKKVDQKLYERIGDPEKAPTPTSRRKGKNNKTAIENEPTTGPKGGSKKAYKPNVEERGANGVTKASRVGVAADSLPPPPKIGELPNLTKHERRIERTFRDAFNKNPDKIASRFLEIVKSQGGVPTFGTDDAKVLHPAWGKKDMPLSQRSQNRATLNNALHQVANAIAKRAFVKHLDTLKPGDEVLVTVGGCGAGKGYALKNVPQALEMKKRAKAVWDSAGDQNATENPWIQKELEKRGLKGNYVYVHADPYSQWADPARGVVNRAADPSDGRMVDAKVFADSYALGAKNHAAFYETNRNNPNAAFVFLSNIGKPVLIEGIPESALKLDRIALGKFAIDTVQQSDAPAHIKRGATQGLRIWGEDD